MGACGWCTSASEVELAPRWLPSAPTPLCTPPTHAQPFVECWTHNHHTVNVVLGYCQMGDLANLMQKRKVRGEHEEGGRARVPALCWVLYFRCMFKHTRTLTRIRMCMQLTSRRSLLRRPSFAGGWRSSCLPLTTWSSSTCCT